jgi:dinuclear metal center YbgI/SA1388 family protein
MIEKLMRKNIPLHSIVDYLNVTLSISKFTDIALNGLQIESRKKEVSKVAFSVDSGLSVMEVAVNNGADLLVTHHGVFWGRQEPLVGPLATKAGLCLTNELSLYAVHLPLDGHETLGNAAQIASQALNCHDVRVDFLHQGAPLGVIAKLKDPLPLTVIAENLARCEGALNPPLLLPFGAKVIRTIGIVTGSGSTFMAEAARKGVDLFISGEPKQEAYHSAKELSLSTLFIGHYASETFGVRALKRVLEEKFGVETLWISEPTGI